MSDDPRDPDADLDRLSPDQLESLVFGPDPDRKSRPAPRKTTPRPVPARLATRPTKFCHACGDTIDQRAEICPKCGVRQHALSVPASARGEKNRLAAALLAFFLGGIGVHRFYLGQVGAGVVMLLFCWTGIPWLVGMIDFVRYLVMSDQRFETLYG